MTQKTQLTTEQIAAIVVGMGLGSAFSSRNDIARFFSNSLGETGGFVVGLLAMGVIGAIAGLLLHALIKWLHSGHENPA